MLSIAEKGLIWWRFLPILSNFYDNMTNIFVILENILYFCNRIIREYRRCILIDGLIAVGF